MIIFEDIEKRYKDDVVLKKINFEIKRGEIFVLLGASGCGKTTCLKMINRLEKPSKGRILFKGEDIRKKELISYRRNIGYVLQSTGLFPHMTVRENLSLLQEIEHIPKKTIDRTNAELMSMVGLDGEMYMDRFPHQLSGGQKQRVGVARAFALDPEVVLMDEPFSAVDPLVRLSLQDELLNIQKKTKKTIVFVTHDIGEAFRIGDKICLFYERSVAQCGTPDELLNCPSNEYVKSFIAKSAMKKNNRQIAIEDMVNRDIIIARPDEKIESLISRLENKRDRKVIIVDENKIPVGMASYFRITGSSNKGMTVDQVMWPYFEAVESHASIEQVITMMNQYGVSYLPVMYGTHNVIGTISAIDILNVVE